MAIVPVMFLLQIIWISLSRVLILLKCHHWDFEDQSRDMIRILSHAEIFFICCFKMLAKWKYGFQGFYGTLKSMSMTFMDSMAMFIVQTLSLQLIMMRCERPLLIRLSLTCLLFLLLPESLGLNLARIRLSLK